MKALFTSEKYIKENTPINDNVDVKMLKNAIVEAQELHLLESIGTSLYNDLSDKILNDTLNSDELVLLQLYITPMMKYWVMVEGLPMLLFKLTNKSVSTSTSDNSQPVQYEDMKYMLNQSRVKAEIYTDRLIKYLQSNYDKFPKFYEFQSSVDAILPKTNQYTTSWYLGEGQFTAGRTNDSGDIR